MSRMEAIRTKTPFTRDNVDSNLPEDSGSIMIVPLDVELPVIPEAFSHLRELFFLSGQVMQTGMGLVPISWSELKAFIEVSRFDLTWWEISLLRKMSEAYCNEYSHASSPSRPAPYSVKADEESAEEASITKGMGISAAMAAFRGKKVRK